MNVVDARKLLSKEVNNKYSDEEVKKIIYSFSELAEIGIDYLLSLKPEERAKYSHYEKKIQPKR